MSEPRGATNTPCFAMSLCGRGRQAEQPAGQHQDTTVHPLLTSECPQVGPEPPCTRGPHPPCSPHPSPCSPML